MWARSAIAISTSEVGQLRSSERPEVHGQEGDVVEHVSPPEVLVELQAVEDDRTVGHEEDVLGTEIAMAVSDASGCDPAAEQRFTSVQVPLGELVGPRRDDLER